METLNLQETSDSYKFVVKKIDDKHRIIRCKDDIQYISQIRTGGSSRWPWRAISFYTTRAGAARQSYPFQVAALALFPEDGCRKPTAAAGKPDKGSGYTHLPETPKAALRYSHGQAEVFP